MTIRRSKKSLWKSGIGKGKASRSRFRTGRDLRLELLEDRRLMATGPRLAGIQPNDGDLLQDGQVRNVAPRDLTFHFTAPINVATLGGIRITRSGFDGQFDRSSASTDFNTDGAVLMDFTSAVAGATGDGISINFIRNALGAGAAPRVSVFGDAIQVELNSTAGSQTQASQLVTALNNHPTARNMVVASIRRGAGSTNIAAPSINYSPLVLRGANTASVTSDFNAGTNFEIEITASAPGEAGNGIEVVVTKSDRGGVSPPRVSVTNRTINVDMNSNALFPTTARDLVDAINTHAQAGALVTARITSGRSDTPLGNRAINYSPLRLTGVSDVIVEPGFIGVGESPQQIVVRFKEALPDDLYHVDVVGTGAAPLRGANGSAFGDATDDGLDSGVDFSLNFELNLGAQILAVVPQPISRLSNGALTQARNQIHVYFNDDDLYTTKVVTGQISPNPLVVDPAFYQLIFTKDTLPNTDDTSFQPVSVAYDPAVDRAVLTFASDLDQLPTGAGTYRLRIGTNEAKPLPPVLTNVAAAVASSDFGTQNAVVVAMTAKQDFASQVSLEIRKRDFGGPGLPAVSVAGQRIVVELNTNAANKSTAQNLVDALNQHAAASLLLTASIASAAGTGSTVIADTATAGAVLSLTGLGSSFDTATNLGALGPQSQVLASRIDTQLYDLAFPGAISEPGHRDLREEVARHFLQDNGDTFPGITTAYYNFQDQYGVDPDGNVLRNAITEAQKQRTREILTLFSEYLGIQFIESANLGMTIATGDLRAIDPDVTTGPGGVIGIASGDVNTGRAVMDAQDFGPGDDLFGRSWFETAMHEIGHLLGIGHTTELAPWTIMGDTLALAFPENTIEPIFPGANDIIHGQHLFRPEGKDIDLYRFTVASQGRFSAETFAERLPNTSLLDPVISLFREETGGRRVLIARNDDYYSKDSYLELDLGGGTYWVGVTASGNDDYDPTIEDTGLGGRSEGDYQLRLGFRPAAGQSILDATGVKFDGDADGVPGGVFNFWFRAQTPANTIIVDKAALSNGPGTIASPRNNLGSALTAATPGQVVRVVGNYGSGGDAANLADDKAYEIGFDFLGLSLSDGSTLDVPKGVTLMIDASAILKLRRARVGVGSSSTTVDRSGAALQVLGTPLLVNAAGAAVRDANGRLVPGSVYFTSYSDEKTGLDTYPAQTTVPAAGDWGGIAFRNDIDGADKSRFSYEREGIFINTVSQTDIRYGGGSVLIAGVPQVVSPVDMADSRPTVSYNTITYSADAAIAANPNSFEETNFHSPAYQFVPFTSDYDRVGPDVHGNRAVNNSVNGLFVRVTTPAGGAKQTMTVAGRWDDMDIPHVLADRLAISGTPGGPILEASTPPIQLVTLTAISGGQLDTGTYNYRIAFVDRDGNESAPSGFTRNISIDATKPERAVRLDNLPLASGNFVAKRIYRSDKTASATGIYTLIAEIGGTTASYTDDGSSLNRTLSTAGIIGLRPRQDARLSIDPGVVVKFNGGGIETTFGADFYAEGVAGRDVVLTSLRDNRYGGGGTFDTSGLGSQVSAAPGDWGGVFVGHATRASFDHAVLAYGGGEMNVEGGFANFNVLEIHESPARVANSVLERNASGIGGQLGSNRVGHGFNRSATLLVRGAQPVIVENTFLDNTGAAISIDADSLNLDNVSDFGRSTFATSDLSNPLDAITAGRDNQGPLVFGNRLDRNEVNAMQIRGTTLTNGGVWDDTSIVHLLRNETVYVPDFHTFGGLRLESKPNESLVVKFDGSSAGITATGRPLDIDDRIGGAVYIIGQPGFPVILTSAFDPSASAGTTPSGAPQNFTIQEWLDPSFVGGGTRFDFNIGPLAAANPQVVQGIQEAGRLWSAVLADPVTVTIDVELGATTGNVLAFATTRTELFPYDQVRNLMVQDAGVYESALVSSLPQFANLQTLLPNASYVVNPSIGITPANAKAIGIPPSQLTQVRSQYDPTEIIDSTITIGSAALGGYDFNRGDGIAPGLIDFVGVMMHEIGHSLGFTSAVDGVDAGITNVVMTPMDMFRVQPGSVRPASFTTAPRVLDPRIPVQVLYDGGRFDPAGLPVPGLGKGDLPMSTGQVNGDGYQASHFKDDNLLGGFLMGLLDPAVSNGVRLNLTANDKRVFDFIGWNVAGAASPGDWWSVRLDKYSHDRNVEVNVEDEAADVAAPGSNATASSAQFLGALAPGEKAGDENLRLGFDVHGTLSARNDVDVYTFSGAAGTEVWLDIDQTQNKLDTVVELIDDAGNALARSNDSLAEISNPSLLYRSAAMPADSVKPLRKAYYDPQNPSTTSSLAIEDAYTTNPRDAGMRVVLPGQPGSRNTYHVRVRSAGSVIDDATAGRTSGNYRLQIRLRELDEAPGSAVRYADIRYATNGIEVFGQPAHSPLLGETTEVERFDPLTGTITNSNDVFANAQNLGNLLQTDRGALSTTGDLLLPSDVDFYRLTVDYDSLQQYNPRPYLSTIFDIDYADGLARPNTELWVFDSEGRLILRGAGSNVAEDRFGSLSGTGMSDTSRGSAGGLDPYIGPVELPAGPDVLDLNPALPEREVYYVAVSSNAQIPDELRQYLEPNPPNPYVRLEPVTSTRRIAEDRVEMSGGSFVANSPTLPVLIDRNTSAVPFHLGDVTLFVATRGGLAPNTISTLRTVDAYTGSVETIVGSFPEPVVDIAMRGDGNLFGYTAGPDNFRGNLNDQTIGTYVQIDTGTAATAKQSDDGLETNVEDPMNLGNPERAPQGANNDGVGMLYNAMAYESTSNAQYGGWVIGSRRTLFGDNSPDEIASSPYSQGIGFAENVLYHFDINSGVVASVSPGQQDKQNQALLTGPGTQKWEYGEVLTFTRIVPMFPEVGDVFTITINGKSISYRATQATAQDVVAGLATEWSRAALSNWEFAAFEVLNSASFFSAADELRVRLVNPAAAYLDIQTSTLDGGTGLSFLQQQLVVEGGGPGGIVTGMDFVGGTIYAVTDRGGLYQVFGATPFFSTGQFFFASNNIASYVRSSAMDLMTANNGQPIRFSGLRRGPANAEGGQLADTLFGISEDGRIYAFNTEGELQPVFMNNQTSVSTGLFNVNGFAFSTLDRNLWTVTGNRWDDNGHGLNGPQQTYVPFDRSREDEISAGSSFYFGNDRSTNLGGNQAFSNTTFVRDYNFPGGAYGSLISRPFSLAGYAAEDRPMLYFNYFLNTENTDYDPFTTPITWTRDTFRVYASSDNGEWTLLATNDLFQHPLEVDEFEYGLNDFQCQYPRYSTEPCVQKLFDNTGTWRQARISLGRLAGQDNVRLRFDVSTAGSMNVGDTFTVGSELRAIQGSELRDGQSFTLDGSLRIEFDAGFTIVAPNGAAIQDGNTFSINTGTTTKTFEFDSDNRFAHDILAAEGRRFRDGEQFQVAAGGKTQIFEFDSGYSLFVPAAGGAIGGVRDADTFRVNNVVFEFDSNGVTAGANKRIDLVWGKGVQVPAAGSGTGGLVDGEQLVINNGVGGPNVVFEFDDNKQVTVGAVAVDITNIELIVPVAGGGFGGVADGHSFTVNDGTGGPDVVFEFDKNNSVATGNRAVPISDQSTQNEIANTIVAYLRAENIGLNPVNQGGGVIRLGIVRHNVDTNGAPTLVRRVTRATQNEIADRLADAILNAGPLQLVAQNAGNGLVRFATTTHVVNTTAAPHLTQRTVFASQSDLANAIVNAIKAEPSLGVTPESLGAGEVYIGRVLSLDTSLTPTLRQSGASGVSDPTKAVAVPVSPSPTETAAKVATSIAAAISASPLGITATANGNVVDLPSGATFSPNATALLPTDVIPIPVAADDSPDAVAGGIQDAILRGLGPVSVSLNLSVESNDRMVTATNGGLPGGPARINTSGFIGDNTSLSSRRGTDVDFVRLDLNAGEHLVATASAGQGSSLSPALRLFDASGQELASTRPTVTTFPGFPGFFFPGFFPTFTPAVPQIDYTILATGVYYLAVSNSANLDYHPAFDGSADVQLRIPAQGGAIGGLTDGEYFTIDDGVNAPVVFEFDNNGQVRPGAVRISLADVLMQIPAVGVAAGGIQDGNTFVINDNRGSGNVVFEFDTNFVTGPGNIRIPVFQGATAATVANAVAAVLQTANLGLTPAVQGSSVLLGTVSHSVNVTSTPSITLSTLPRSQQQVTTLLRDAIRNSSLRLLPTLGSAGSITLDVRAHRFDTFYAPHLSLVVPSGTGAYGLTIDVDKAQPFETHRSGHRINLVGVQDVVSTGLPATFIDGRPGATSPSSTPAVINSSMSADEVAQAIATAMGQATSRYVEQIVAASGFQISDGEMFSLSDGTVTVNFEFESGYSLQIPNSGADPSLILDGESFSITNRATTRTFEFDANGTIKSGNTRVRVNDIALLVPFGGVAFGGIRDGESFAIRVGTAGPRTVFEFDTNNAAASGNVAIRLSPTDQQNAVANAMVQAILNANLGLSPRNAGQGVVQLGVANHTVDITLAPGLSQSTIQLTQTEVANRIVSAVAAAGLGLTPTHLGSGLIHLGGTSSHTVDVSQALGLSVSGAPGAIDPNAIIIPVFPSTAVSPSQVSSLMLSAINTARATRNLNINAVAGDSRRINLSGPKVITDFTHAPSLSVNLAGSSVKTYENIVRVIGHTVSTPGPLGLETSLAGDLFGAYEVGGPPNVTQYPGALRGMNNAFEGVYLDDIIIGFAERGEMITGANVNSAMVPNAELFNATLPVGLVPHNEIHVGPYQLEVRQAEPYGFTYQDALPSILPVQSFDTNDRMATAVSLDVQAGDAIADGETFALSDGRRTVTFEFDDLDLPANNPNIGVKPGHVRIPYYASNGTSRAADTAIIMARRIRDIINGSEVQALLSVTAGLADGAATGTASTSTRINLYGPAQLTFGQVTSTRTETVLEPNDTLSTAPETGIGTAGITTYVGTGTIGDNTSLTNPRLDVDLFEVVLNAGEGIIIDVDALANNSKLESVVRVFDANGIEVAYNDAGFVNGPLDLDPYLTFTAASSGTYYVGLSSYFNAFYNPRVAGSGFLAFYTGPYTIRISAAAGFRVVESSKKGDRNLDRDQGQLLIQSNRISNSAGFGILADAGTRDGASNAPHLGPARLTAVVNTANLATGVTAANNVITGNGLGGIRFSGDPSPAGQQRAAVPFGRIVNNTIVGRARTGIGIRVDENASPTLLNNVLADLATGISVDPTSATTIVGGTLFKDNATNTTGVGSGSFAILLGANDPLFANAAAGNFLPAPGAKAIDSSLNALQDRPEMITVRNPLGFAPSPIVAPELDAFGQKRVDDPAVSTPPGQGANVFIDRGALDRADFIAPSAVLIDPRDNDAGGRDGDSRPTFVEMTNAVLSNFSIQIADGFNAIGSQSGTGADDGTVRSSQVSVYRDGVKLVVGTDYSFDYDATNNVIRLTPLAGIWEPDRVYEIELANAKGFVITTRNGAVVADRDSFQVTDAGGRVVTFEYDSGYSVRAPQTLALQMPAAGGAVLRDGETFAITSGTTRQVFEFDNNGARTIGNIAITFTSTDSANELANKIVAALATSALGLSPKNIVNFQGRAVHLGSTSAHGLDTTGTQLTQTGVAAGVEKGQSFTIDDGKKVVTFEFADASGPSGANRFSIMATPGQTHEEIADAIAAVVNSAGVGLAATHAANSEGLVHLGGTPVHVVNVTNSKLSLIGQAGVQPAWGIKIPTIGGVPDYTAIQDGQTFRIINGANPPVTFELDSNTLTTAGNRIVSFNTSMTALQLASAIAVAIRDGGVGLIPTSSADGIVTLGGTSSYQLDVTGTVLRQIGQAGVPAAQPVYFKPGDTYTPGVPVRQAIFSEQDMAVSVQNAINTAVANGLLVGVTATVRQQSAQAAVGEVIVDGATSVTGTAAAFRSNITDLAGNPLSPNRPDGSTRFTIFVGSGVDFGDAPSPYPTLEAQDGARHQIVEGFFLGQAVDVDIDGQSNADATGDDADGFDDEDGVQVTQALTGGLGGTIRVTASKAGLLDAWIDFNQNGSWSDPGEQVLVSRALNAGANDINLVIPGTAAAGNTFARFRFSSTGGLAPTGYAADGEVEDYRVTIVGNPWRNSSKPQDVNADGYVMPLDALIIINDLNKYPNDPQLPGPRPALSPPYLDVNGDLFVTPLDALIVINLLNTIFAAEGGEGESSGAASAASWTASAAVVAEGGAAARSLLATSVVDHRISVSAYNATPTSLAASDGRAASSAASAYASFSARGGESEGFEELIDHIGQQSPARPLSAYELIFQGGEL